jgi:hypothetical protein
MITFDPILYAERCLQDAMTEALPGYWLSRALDFDLVNPAEVPLPLDASPDVVAAAPVSAQCALACRRHAWLLRSYGLPAYINDEISDVMAEVAA